MNFLHKSKVDPLTKTHFFCLVHVIPISHLSYPPGPLVVFWETPSRNFLFFWPGLISWLHRFLKSVVSFRARPSRVISMFSSRVYHVRWTVTRSICLSTYWCFWTPYRNVWCRFTKPLSWITWVIHAKINSPNEYRVRCLICKYF